MPARERARAPCAEAFEAHHVEHLRHPLAALAPPHVKLRPLIAQGGAGLRVIRIDLDNALKCARCFFRFLKIPQSEAAIEMRSGVIGSGIDRGVVFHKGVRKIPALSQHITEVVAALGMLRPHLYRAPEQAQGLIPAIGLPADHAQQVEGVGLVWFLFKHLTVSRFRLGERT